MLNGQKMEDFNIDYKMGLARFANKESLYEKYIFKFLEDEHYKLAVAAFEENNMQGILESIHAFKGVVGTLGFNELFEISSKIVSKIRNNDFDDLETLMGNLKVAYDSMYNFIKGLA